MKKKLLIMLTMFLFMLSAAVFKTDTLAAKKNFKACAVTNGFFGEKTDFTAKYKNGVITLNGTMEYIKGKKGTGKKVKFKKKRFRVAKKCKYSVSGGTVKGKKYNLIKYFKKNKIKKLSGYVSIVVKNKKIVNVLETD